MTEKNTYELRNVTVHDTYYDEDVKYLTGHIFGDTDRNFQDGKFIRTSQVVGVKVDDGVTTYETLNSFYVVKEVSDDGQSPA